jgi:hypothetical protein
MSAIFTKLLPPLKVTTSVFQIVLALKKVFQFRRRVRSCGTSLFQRERSAQNEFLKSTTVQKLLSLHLLLGARGSIVAKA